MQSFTQWLKRLPGMYVLRPGGMGIYLEQVAGIETRVTVPGQVQWAGAPSALDRMVALVNTKIIDIPLAAVISVPKRVDAHGDAVQTARGWHFFW